MPLGWQLRHWRELEGLPLSARQRDINRKRKHREDYPEHHLLAHAKRRAKAKGIPFDLTLSDIHVPRYCPALGLELRVNEGIVGPDSPSLDRIIPSLGYVKGNVIVVSHLANSIKSYATVQQLLLVASFYQQLTPSKDDEDVRVPVTPSAASGSNADP